MLKSEAKFAEIRLNRNKATGQDGIVNEMLADLEEFNIDKITDINKLNM